MAFASSRPQRVARLRLEGKAELLDWRCRQRIDDVGRPVINAASLFFAKVPVAVQLVNHRRQPDL
jgi:hypothetical protein